MIRMKVQKIKRIKRRLAIRPEKVEKIKGIIKDIARLKEEQRKILPLVIEEEKRGWIEEPLAENKLDELKRKIYNKEKELEEELKKSKK